MLKCINLPNFHYGEIADEVYSTQIHKIHRMYRIRTPHTHSFQQGMAVLAVKSYVGWADWMSAGRPKPLGSAGNALLGPIDPIDRFRVWCVVPPSVSLSQRLEEYLSWNVSICAALAIGNSYGNRLDVARSNR